MRHFKFSLTNLLTLVAVVALCLTVFLTSRNLWRTQSELALVKKTYGELDVGDPNFLHARGTPPARSDALQWRWQLHLPPNKKWRLAARIGSHIPVQGIPPNGPTTRGASLRIKGDPTSAQILASVSVARLSEDGVVLTLESVPADESPSRTRLRLPHDHLPDDGMAWLLDSAGGSTELLAGQDNTQVHATDTPFFLLVHRKSALGKTSNNPNPATGIVVWIEEVPSR